jgi:hypothetical protein
MVAWRNDVHDPVPAEYSFTKLDVPELTSEPLPTLILTPTPTPLATETAVPSTPTTPQPGNTNSGTARPGTISPLVPIILGIAPALLLVVIIIWFKRSANETRR